MNLQALGDEVQATIALTIMAVSGGYILVRVIEMMLRIKPR